MTYIASTKQVGGSGNATAVIAVPTGAAVDDIAIIGLYTEMPTAEAITFPSGFTIKTDLSTSPDTTGRLTVAWKRLTAADTGNYTVTWPTATYRAAVCGIWRGRTTSGDPFDGAPGTATAASGTTAPSVSATPAQANGDAVYILINWQGSATFLPPTNYTERQDEQVITLDTRDTIAAGSTGSVQGTTSVSGPLKAFLGVLAEPVVSSIWTTKKIVRFS